MELLIPLILLALVVPMFLGVRRQKKELAKSAELQESLQVGDRVMTTSGLYGTIVEIDETTVDLEIAEEVVTTWSRAVVREKIADDHFDNDDADGQSSDAAAQSSDAAPTVEESAQQTERRLNQE